MQLSQARIDTKSSNFLILVEGTADRNQHSYFNRVLHNLLEFFDSICMLKRRLGFTLHCTGWRVYYGPAVSGITAQLRRSDLR